MYRKLCIPKLDNLKQEDPGNITARTVGKFRSSIGRLSAPANGNEGGWTLEPFSVMKPGWG